MRFPPFVLFSSDASYWTRAENQFLITLLVILQGVFFFFSRGIEYFWPDGIIRRYVTIDVDRSVARDFSFLLVAGADTAEWAVSSFAVPQFNCERVSL